MTAERAPLPSRRRALRRRPWLLVMAPAVLAACTAAEPSGATFVLPDTDVVSCQEHQTEGPTEAYAGDESSDTVAMLDLLRYWTENGAKPYCDGEPPTEVDLQWQETVTRLQGG